ncbi:MAG: glycoside hydrolase domain-containing protein [Pyrinomonadaceae bacterium]
MKIIGATLLTLTLFSSAAFSGSPNRLSIFYKPPPASSGTSVIRGIQVFGKSSGIVYTSSAAYRTDDNGATWTELPIGRLYPLASIRFADEENGTAVLIDQGAFGIRRYDTRDGGSTWIEARLGETPALLNDLENADLESAVIWTDENGIEILEFRLSSSSNFDLTVSYRRGSDEATWGYRRTREKDPNHQEIAGSPKKDRWGGLPDLPPGRYHTGFLPEDPVIMRDENTPNSPSRVHSNWYVTQNGSCVGPKSGCVQTTALYKTVRKHQNAATTFSFQDITPPQLVELNQSEKEAARIEADQNRMFAAPPGGSIRTSLNRGFDKCQAGTVAQMQLWWNNSYFFDTNIYFSGRNRACPSQPFTNNPSWIDQVSAMGWGLIPTVVGYQSPCTSSTTTAKLSYDPVVAGQQGRGEADIAAADAASIGLTTGSVLYYDMERYDPPNPDTLGCRTATVAFLKGWTERIHELGYVSGVYGSPKNAIEDWQSMPPASRMDAVWMARWDNVPSVWTFVSFPTFPSNLWNNHQRIKQWQAPHNETWGGVTFNIDGNIADGPVAGIPVPPNIVADFDGDGKTDISVFRPGTGRWYIAGSLGPSYNYYDFGSSSDILAPGDYDGDGKTDFAVFRPSNSTWYFRTKGAYTYRQYGETGDIPAPADYNGDGRTDIALFRPSTGRWYIAFSDSLHTYGQLQFGQDGDRPAAADYDGDGKADIAVWRPSNGTWYVQGSAGAYTVITWGEPTDVPAQGDYDGDGSTDRAVFRPSEGKWHLFQSSEGIRVQQFGVDGDIPVTGDYDGDGHYDVSVFRPSNGTWYLHQSQGAYVVRQFGIVADKPIPTEYLPR